MLLLIRSVNDKYLYIYISVCMWKKGRTKVLTKAAKELNTRGLKDVLILFSFFIPAVDSRGIFSREFCAKPFVKDCVYEILHNTFVCSRFVVLMLCTMSQVYASDISEAKKEREIFYLQCLF